MAKETGDTLPAVWNRPIDPGADPGFPTAATQPVTLEDLGGTYQTCGLRDIPRDGDRTDMERFRRALDQWHNAALAPGESSADLLSHNFGKVLWPHLGFLKAEDWPRALEELHRRGLYVFDCWGTIPGCLEQEKGGCTCRISDEDHERALEILGHRLLGWDNGENDGRWCWQHARLSPAPATREEAHRNFLCWFTRFVEEDLQGYANALCGLTFPHHFARMNNHRMIGAEFLQALPSVTMWAAWVRGAARQYQKLWAAGISIWSQFGYKSFKQDAYEGDSAQAQWMGTGNPQMQTGPDRGPSMSLVRRTWLLLWVYGANVETLEAFQFLRPSEIADPGSTRHDSEAAPEAKREYLSPIGRLQLDATAFCNKRLDRRGVQYCPVAALVDFHCGWTPPRHLYSDSFYTVWGSMPYERGDHQIDLFFREIFPGYQECNYFRDERGFLTPTPCGDIVDVLLSDVREHILARYPAACLLGETCVEGEVLDKLTRYVEAGGEIIWSLPQLDERARRMSGIAALGAERQASASRICATGEWFEEVPFTLTKAQVEDADVLVETPEGDPVVVTRSFGKGTITTLLVPFGTSGRIDEPHPLVGGDPERDVNTLCFYEKPMGSPYRFLEGVRKIWFEKLASFNLVEIVAGKDPLVPGSPARPCHVLYVTNVTEAPDRLLVTVINNELFPIYARLKGRNAQIIRAVDLLCEDLEMPLTDGAVELTLFPSDNADNNIFICELTFDTPVVRFQQG